MKKKILAGLLCITMILTMLPMVAFAGDGVCKIGTTEYQTLAEAIEAVPTTGVKTTITMIADIGSESNFAEFSNVYANKVSNGKNIVLDLAGKHVFAKTTENGESCFIRVENGGKLTIKDSIGDGFIKYLDAKDNTGGFVVCSAGDFTLESGTLENTTICEKSAIQGAVDVHANEWGTPYYTHNTSFTMNGGVLKSVNDNTLRVYDSSQTGSGKVNFAVDIKGGEIYGADAVFIQPQTTKKYDVSQTNKYMNPMTINVSGGKFETKNGIRVYGSIAVINEDTCPININVTGGTFTTSDVDKQRVSGVAFQSGSSNEIDTKNIRSFVAVNGKVADDVKMGDETYPTLADAISDIEANNTSPVTIELLTDIVLGSTVSINKDNVTIDGKGFTIKADNSKNDWAKYKVGGSNQKFGQLDLIKVSGKNITVKDVTIDVKDYRGMSCMTTKGGENITFEKVNYKGRGSAHYYGYGKGTLSFKNCEFDTKGYAVHCSSENPGYTIIIDNCVVHGWNSFGGAAKIIAKDSTFFGAFDGDGETPKNGLLAKFRPYSETIIENCKFSEDYLNETTTYCGIDSGAKTVVKLDNCSIITNDGKASTHKLYELIDYRESDVMTKNQGNSQETLFAFDSVVDSTQKYTGGIFVTKDDSEIVCATDFNKVKIDVADSDVGANVYIVGKEAEGSDNKVTAGKFVYNPLPYVAEGYSVKVSGDKEYPYEVYEITQEDPAQEEIIVDNPTITEIGEKVDPEEERVAEEVLEKVEVTGVADALTEEGQEKIIDKAVKDKSELTQKVVDDALQTQIDVVVEAVAVELKVETAIEVTKKSITFELTPYAFVTAIAKDGSTVSSDKVHVENDYLSKNAEEPITVVLGTTFEPQQVLHIRKNGVIEAFKLGKEASYKNKTYKYNKDDGTVTLQILDFSEVKLLAEKLNEYDVSFDADGGTGTMPTQKIVYGSAFYLPECEFTAPANKKFKSWKIGNKEYNPGDKIEAITENTKIKAVWIDTAPDTGDHNNIVLFMALMAMSLLCACGVGTYYVVTEKGIKINVSAIASNVKTLLNKIKNLIK